MAHAGEVTVSPMRGHPLPSLGPSPPFDVLSQGERDGLVRAGWTKRFRRGDALFRRDGHAGCVFVVLAGAVRLVAATGHGRDLVFRIAARGELVGVLEHLDGERAGADARGVTDGTALAIPWTAFHERVERSPPFALRLARMAAAEARSAQEMLLDFTTLGVSGRVAKRLLELRGRAGGATSPGPVGVALSQQDLADLVGAARESVGKVLSEFAAKGWVDRAGRRYVVLDPAALAERAGLESAGAARLARRIHA